MMMLCLQQVPDDDDLGRLVREGKYLKALDLATQRAKAKPSGPQGERARRALAITSTYVGDPRQAAKLAGALRPETSAEADPVLGTQPHDDALETIVRSARSARVVILNEHHALGQNRAFALRVLEALAAEGFDTFAAEAFAPSITEGRPLSAQDADVMPDPLFTALVRSAVHAKMQLVPFEVPGDLPPLEDWVADANRREGLMAANLAAVLERKKDARVFVYCGFNHAWERGEPELLPMAAQLTRLTGIDPLTIDQTFMINSESERGLPPAYRFALKQPWLTRPIIAGTWHFEADTDLQVIHPPTKWVLGRADWLVGLGGRKLVPVPRAMLPRRGRALLRALQGDEVLAFDHVLVTPSGEYAFALAPGAYRIVSQDAEGREVTLGPLLVEP